MGGVSATIKPVPRLVARRAWGGDATTGNQHVFQVGSMGFVIISIALSSAIQSSCRASARPSISPGAR